jgi:upstream activation factor subunit UAF30
VQAANLETMTVKNLRQQLENELMADLAPYKSLISDLIKSALQKRLGDENEIISSHDKKSHEENSHENYLIGNSEDKTEKILTKEDQEEQDRLFALQLQAEDSPRLLRRATTVSSTRKRSSLSKSNKGTSEDSPPKKKRNSKSNGFPDYTVSAPLSAFLNGAEITSSSRVIKHIWDYIKEKNLQDQNDKRYILCDEKLQNVLAKPRIHMFHIAKEVQKHLYPIPK